MTNIDSHTRTDDVRSRKGLLFDSFSLKPESIKGIVFKGFREPTPVQEEAIPAILSMKDCLIRAKNGTGKTASYLIPLLNRIDPKRAHPQVIVIVPTRELGLQAIDVANELGKFLNIKTMSATGGTPISQDVENIKSGANIIIGTSGRVSDLVRRDIVDAQKIMSIVIDEADQVILMDPKMKFALSIFSKLSPNVQIVLVSATFPPAIGEFCKQNMKSPLLINTMNELTLIGVTQFHVFLDEKEKIQCIYTLLSKLLIKQAFIFCNSIERVKNLTNKLNQLGFVCSSIHSKMSQSERTNIYKEFVANKFRFLVSSDLCSRGIDIVSVNVVINFDIPRKSATYLHRIGRSGRYGSKSVSISFITERDIESLKVIETDLGINIPPVPPRIDESIYN